MTKRFSRGHGEECETQERMIIADLEKAFDRDPMRIILRALRKRKDKRDYYRNHNAIFI